MGLNGNNREYEYKFTSTQAMNTLASVIKANFKVIGTKKGSSYDIFWEPKITDTCDFVRLRHFDKIKGELTLKHTDKSTIRDRFEVDVPVSNTDQARILLTMALGKPKGDLYKIFTVYFLDKFGTNISIYQITKDNVVFVEVESNTMKKARRITNQLKKLLKLKVENRSLYTIYFKS